MSYLLLILTFGFVMCEIHQPSVFDPYMSICICATGIKPSVAYNWLKKDEFVNDPCLGCFINCVGTKAGLEIDDSDAFDRLVPDIDPVKISFCQNKTLDLVDPCKRSFVFSKCLHDK
ncbi:hypothetical protein FQR65_LT10400 [Abscondita terminalis]|nr:hypothetical protein FQR65_LT10400 [Abscondita terminalis]